MPESAANAEPVEPPKQATGLLVEMLAAKAEPGCVIVTVAVPEQPFVSVTVTV